MADYFKLIAVKPDTYRYKKGDRRHRYQYWTNLNTGSKLIEVWPRSELYEDLSSDGKRTYTKCMVYGHETGLITVQVCKLKKVVWSGDVLKSSMDEMIKEM